MEILKSALTSEKELDALKVQYKAVIRNIEGLHGLDYSRAKTTGGPVRDLSLLLEEVEEKATRQKMRILNKAKELMDLKAQAFNLIQKLDDPNERMILSYYYLSGYKVDDIAEEMHYSREYISKLKTQGLEHVARIQ